MEYNSMFQCINATIENPYWHFTKSFVSKSSAIIKAWAPLL